MSYAATSDNAPVRGDLYTNQLMSLVGAHVKQHVAAQVSALEAKIAALKFEVEAQNAEMATMRSALAAVGLQKEIDGQAAEMAALRAEIAGLRHILVTNAIAPVKDEIIAELRKEVPTYVGVFRPDTTWAKGSICSWDGALWHANRPTSEKPGGADSGWQLCVKSGASISEKRISTLEREVRDLTRPKGVAEPRR
jgi:hypothetical protein